jgi:hypothetical protein
VGVEDACLVGLKWTGRDQGLQGRLFRVRLGADLLICNQDSKVVAVVEFPAGGVVEGMRIEVFDGGEKLANVGAGTEGLGHGDTGRHGGDGGPERGDFGETERGEMRLKHVLGEGEGLRLRARGGGNVRERKESEGCAVFLAAKRCGDVGGGKRCHGGG